MRKSVTFRFDPDLLTRVRQSAAADHRSLTNFVETALRRAIERPSDPPPPDDASKP